MSPGRQLGGPECKACWRSWPPDRLLGHSGHPRLQREVGRGGGGMGNFLKTSFRSCNPWIPLGDSRELARPSLQITETESKATAREGQATALLTRPWRAGVGGSGRGGLTLQPAGGETPKLSDCSPAGKFKWPVESAARVTGVPGKGTHVPTASLHSTLEIVIQQEASATLKQLTRGKSGCSLRDSELHLVLQDVAYKIGIKFGRASSTGHLQPSELSSCGRR